MLTQAFVHIQSPERSAVKKILRKTEKKLFPPLDSPLGG